MLLVSTTWSRMVTVTHPSGRIRSLPRHLHTACLTTARRAVVDKVEAELLTPVGLRTLSPRDPKYIPYYTGTPFERDSGYHQGTVWAWLLGGFIDAHTAGISGPRRPHQ